jgi:hypothetical protein
MRLETIAKTSLVVLLVPATLVSFTSLFVGLTFGLNLWRSDRPFAIALWFAEVMFPGFIVAALRLVNTCRQLLKWTAAAWTFAGFWVFHNFIWMPWGYGGW